MKKQILDLTVIENRKLNGDYNILTLTYSKPLPKMLPGQFVNFKVEGSPSTFLRRPISVHDVDIESNTFKVLIQIVGEGSGILANKIQGSSINTIIPLGNCFTIPNGQMGKILLIGGGCGIAPLLFLGKELKKQGHSPSFLLGARTKSGLIEMDQYESVGEVFTTTEDGSFGQKGFVIHHPVLWDDKNPIERIYTCGPEPMMKAVAKFATKHNIDCEVSLENMMACGFGVCLCCVTPTTQGNKCTCTDGPIFNIKDLTWQI